MKKAFLLLANGILFEGINYGHEGRCTGEVVFNTGMVGYQEVMTNPSYYGQIVTMTYPLIGNYGISFADDAMQKSWISGLIMREASENPSNWKSRCTLDAYLKSQRVIGLAGIDTRWLMRILRDAGVMNGVIYTEGWAPDEDTIAQMRAYSVQGAVKAVTAGRKVCHHAVESGRKYRVALLDFGTVYDVAAQLQARDCAVTVLPAGSDPLDVLADGYDGLVLGSGPGDPAENQEIIGKLRMLADSGLPIFGIGLGHQLMALAYGAKISKMHFGHHGLNQPVKDLDGERTFITRQSHGYVVDGNSLDPQQIRARYLNLNDGTIEGIVHCRHPWFTVQFCPETSPGPSDTSFLFDRFLANIEHAQGGTPQCH